MRRAKFSGKRLGRQRCFSNQGHMMKVEVNTGRLIYGPRYIHIKYPKIRSKMKSRMYRSKRSDLRKRINGRW